MLDYEPFKQLWKSHFQCRGAGQGEGEGGGERKLPPQLCLLSGAGALLNYRARFLPACHSAAQCTVGRRRNPQRERALWMIDKIIHGV